MGATRAYASAVWTDTCPCTAAFDRAACPLCRRPIASARFEASGLDKPRTLGRGAPRRLATNGRVFGSAYISLCAPPADELKVVLDGANILYANIRTENVMRRGYQQGAQRNWEALRCAVEHFRGSGIQPIVALSAGEFASVPPLAVGDAMLQDFVAVASRGFGSTDGEADDVLVVALSEHFKCPFVSNDSFTSWSSLVSAPRRAWIEKAGHAGLRLSHDFVNLPGEGGVFLTEPQYPVELARRLPAAFTVRAAPRVEAARRDVFVALTRVYGADRQPVKSVFEASDDVDFMREKVLDWFNDGDRSKRAPTAFLYGADGVALENGASRLADVFSGEGLSQAAPARVFVLLAEAPPASEVAEIFLGQTYNFTAKTFPRPVDARFCNAAVSAFASTLYVLKDKDSSTQGRVAAGLQLAARAALSAGVEAPLGTALQLLMQAKMLRPCHKVALISGFAAALGHLYPELMNSQPERLLEATPQACSWLAGQALANKYIEISLGGYSSPDVVRLNPPCLIPGHASVGVFNESSALAWARALTGRDVARGELVVSDVCHAMRRLAARTPDIESNDLGARTYSPNVALGASRDTRPPRIDDMNALGRPSRSEGYGFPAFSRLPLLDAVRHQHSSCMIFIQSLLVVCKNHGKKDGEETFERNVFFPLTGESKSLNLKLCASNEARARGPASAVETNRAHNARLAAARPREHRVESRTSPKHDWTRPQRLEAPALAPDGLKSAAFESVEALAVEGLDVLKAELARCGVKAGSTADECAARLWRIRGLVLGAELPRARHQDDTDVSGGEKVREMSESAAAAEHRGSFEQATFVALDISSSMLEKLTRHERDGPEVERGATRTLFVGWKMGAPRTPQDIIAGLHEACKANGVPVPRDVRVHKHREGNRCKSSAHVMFRNAEAAEAAIEALGKVRLWGGKLRLDRAADGRPPAPRGGARAEDPGSRMAHAKLALQCLADRIETLDLPHATGLMLFGSDVTVPCALTPLLELFSTATSKAREARADARGGTTRLVAALHQAAQRLADFGARHECKLSVLLISDGDDTSRDSAFDALRLLRDADVVVDLVVLGGARAGEAAALAEATGCTVYHPQSDSELVAIFEDEATLRLARRAPREPPMPTSKQFQRAAQRLNAALREAHRAGPAVHDSLAAGGLLAPAVSNGAVAGTAAVSSALRQLARPSAPPDDAVIVNRVHRHAKRGDEPHADPAADEGGAAGHRAAARAADGLRRRSARRVHTLARPSGS